MKTNYSLTALTFILLLMLFSIQLQAQVIADGDYILINSVNNEAMTAPNTFADDMANPDFFAYMAAIDTSDDNQIFTFTHLGNDVYTIVNKGTGNYLGIKDSWCGDFGNVQGKFQQSDTNIEFKIVAAAIAETYTIEIAFTQCGFDSVNDPIKAFDIDGGNVGARINTFPKDPMNSNQQFQIVSPNVLNVDNFEIKKENAVSLSPVPANQFVDIQFTKNLGTNITVQVHNTNGQLISSFKIANAQQSTRLDISTISSGFYLLNVIDTKKTILGSKKLIIK